ncbi:MAG: helicase C-terminal domain-containing protein [Candidatus Binatia bacterium]
MSQPALFQENLNLKSHSRFVSSVDVEELGIDSALLDRLVAAGPLCFLDFEATGLDPREEALIEAGAVIVREGQREAEIFNTFIHTDRVLSAFIRRLTGITQDDVAEAPAARDVAEALDEFIGEVPVVAHNTRFESSWLVRAVSPRFETHPFLDTVELLALAYPDTRNLKLDTFCRERLDRKERHRALDDALDTLRVTVGIFEDAAAGSLNGANARTALRTFMPDSGWTGHLSELPAPRHGKPVGDPADRQTDIQAGAKAVPFDLEAISARLADEELCARFVPGYRHRPAQVELLERVRDCLTGKNGQTVHVCEAGTGIGKTLAYLAVAIPFARERGEQVIVSTSSKLLQRQLMEKDIPAVAAMMGYPDLHFTAMKGRANYICRARLDEFLADATSELRPEPSFAAAYVCAFAHSTSHGEVDRVPGVLYQMHPQLERISRDITSHDARECSRNVCVRTHRDCVFRQARDRLEGAELIVANHDLLLRWPPDYPPIRHLIVDEVHELAERADGAYARTAEAVEILHRLDTAGASPVVTEVLKLSDSVARARTLAAAVGAEAKRLVGSELGPYAYRDELPVPFDGPGPAWQQLLDDAGELARTLDTIGRSIENKVGSDDDSAPGAAADALLDAAGVLELGLSAPPEEYVVRFRGLGRPSDTAWRLVATPVNPAPFFADAILDRVSSFFATSATIAVGNDTRGALGTLELDERAGDSFRMDAPVESPFDYKNNLRVLFIDEPTDNARLVGRTVEVLDLVARKLGGRTLGLFTSRERLATVAEALDARLVPEGIRIVAPSTGNADPHDLVRTFVENEHAVLLGARAFWQGVDIPGNTCQAVVIEKLPFDVPGDPLVKRRGEKIERDGGNSFMHYMLPRMLLRLKQMVGRLIRTPTDRGVVIVVEPRSDRRYFRRLLDALPPGATHELVKLEDLPERLDAFFDLES